MGELILGLSKGCLYINYGGGVGRGGGHQRVATEAIVGVRQPQANRREAVSLPVLSAWPLRLPQRGMQI